MTMRKLVLFGVAAGLLALNAQASEEIARKANCLACHSVDKKIVGPAYKDVAAKYKGQADIVAKLAAKVRNGGSGVWGPIPMPPNPPEKISDADLNAVLQWVLSR